MRWGELYKWMTMVTDDSKCKEEKKERGRGRKKERKRTK
mgnify:CR=1 FL=1